MKSTHANFVARRVVSFATLLLPAVLSGQRRGDESDAGIGIRDKSMAFGFSAAARLPSSRSISAEAAQPDASRKINIRHLTADLSVYIRVTHAAMAFGFKPNDSTKPSRARSGAAQRSGGISCVPYARAGLRHPGYRQRLAVVEQRGRPLCPWRPARGWQCAQFPPQRPDASGSCRGGQADRQRPGSDRRPRQLAKRRSRRRVRTMWRWWMFRRPTTGRRCALNSALR